MDPLTIVLVVLLLIGIVLVAIDNPKAMKYALIFTMALLGVMLLGYVP